MTTENFSPTNGLEFELVQLMSGRRTINEFLNSLMDADVHVLSATEVRQDGTGLRPLLFDRDLGTLLAVFTSRDRVAAFSHRFPYCLMLTGRQFFGWIPHGWASCSTQVRPPASNCHPTASRASAATSC